ncbi:MAG: aminotransferase class I/II-fold pyridoxal phosphate-dependent enzyme [Victivallaceae bacterium]|nr:aminotransferase class I/II-fold pyridoxal phosphate-dependent enzyme [Victivallaceae bacterium]
MLPALAGRDDLILADKLDHASLIDGLRLGGAQFQRYTHCDRNALERALKAAAGKYERIFLVTESVFSMDGDAADLRYMARLKKEYGAILVVDEAHAVGVRGPSGLGYASECGVLDDVDVLVGTFGKAFGSAGAYAILGNPVLKTYLINRMRSFIFTTALAPISMAWSMHTFRHAMSMDADRAHLAHLGRSLRAMFGDRSIAGDTQIVPYLVGDDKEAVALAEKFRAHGILVFAIRPPTVPAGTARLRFSLQAAHTDEVLERIRECL